jgi:UV DNA damage endonuclease
MVTLGLCCLDAEGTIKYNTITKKRYDSLSYNDKEKSLERIYSNNIETFKAAIQYCKNSSIGMYRVTSNLFPMLGVDEIGVSLFHEFKDELETVGKLAKKYKVRITVHPDQFNVLSSDTVETVNNSIQNLHYHALTFDYMKLSQTRYNLINIHGGKGNRIQQLIKVVNNLPTNIKNRLTFENDENSYSVEHLIQVYEATGVPVLFDFHHHLCMNKLSNYSNGYMEVAYEKAVNTWEDSSLVTTHISNGTTGLHDRRHSDYINLFPDFLNEVPYVEVEARSKNLALKQLQGLM